MKILVIGSGGREHALSWRLSLDPNVESVFVYPGNPGMKTTPGLTIIPEAISFSRSLQLVKQCQIDLVVIGPEKYLFEGWVDQFREAGVAAYGPTRKASFLEESKIRSKQFMKKYGIKTADFEVARDLISAIHAIDSHPEWTGYVLKLSGPALGKGVIVTHSVSDAKLAAEQFFKYLPPGIEEGMVIENCVSGKEVSLFYVCSGEKYHFLTSACDHKRLKDGDQGPNTGGMGAYSPCDWIDDSFLRDVETKFVVPTLAGMAKESTPFSGTLFLGLMVNEAGASLLEYNTRFGDPETQAILPLIDGNFAQLLLASASGDQKKIKESTVATNRQHSLHVVKAAKGYPGLFGEAIETGQPLQLEKSADPQTKFFFAGVAESGDKLLTSGGRVCGVTAVSESLEAARKIAYHSLGQVSFSGEQFRTDIGARP